MEIWIPQLLQWLALREFGLSTVFVVSVISATLLPLGSEFAVFGLIKLNPALFWPTILVATAGNTLGGALCWVGWVRVGGDPLCAVAGWLKLPFWPCLAYMAVGKFLRYWVMTSALLYFTPEHLLVGSADSDRIGDGCIRLAQVFGGG